MTYLHNQWEKLIVYGTDGQLRLRIYWLKMPFAPLLWVEVLGYLPIRQQAQMPVLSITA
jgi:hypothetical protein